MALPPLDKSQQVAETSARKRALANNSLPTSLEDFVTLNPNATSEDIQQYQNLAGIQQFNKNAIAGATQKLNNLRDTRTVGEIAGDGLNTFMQGGVALAETLYGLGEYASKNNFLSAAYNNAQRLRNGEQADTLPTLDEVTGGASRFFNQARDYWDAQLQSDNSARAQANIEQKQQEYRAKVKNPDNSWWQSVKNESGAVANTVKAYLENPSQILEESLEEIPQLLLGGGLGRQSVKLLTRGMDKDAAAKYLASDAGKKAVDRVATSAGVGTAAASEASANAVQTKAEVLELSEKDLKEGSPYYNELRASGLNHEEAAMRVSDRAFDVVFGLTIPTAGIASKITGAAKLEGTLFIPKSKLAGAVKKQLSAAVIEGTEEALQGGTGQAIQNLGTKLSANENQKITEGIGEAIGQGTVVGAGTGLGVTVLATAPEVLEGTGDLSKAVAKEGNKVARKVAKTVETATAPTEVKEAIRTKDASKITDETSENYNPINAVDVLIRPDFIPVQDTENNETEEDYLVRVKAYADELEKHQRNALKQVVALSQEDPEAAAEPLKRYKQLAQYSTGIVQKIRSGQVDKAFDNLKTEPTDVNAKNEVLGSMADGIFSNISQEQAEEVLTNPNLTEQERVQVESYISLKKAEGVLNRGGKAGQVSQEILKGSKGAIGLNDYTRMVTQDVRNNDVESARTTLKQLNGFVKSQVAKAKQFNEAFRTAVETGEEQKITVNNREYSITDKSNNTGFIDRVNEDTTAVVDTYNSLKSLATAQFTNDTEVTATAQEEVAAPVEVRNENNEVAQTLFEFFTQTSPEDLSDEEINAFLDDEIELDEDALTEDQEKLLDTAIEAITTEATKRNLISDTDPNSGYGLIKSVEKQAEQLAWEVDLKEKEIEKAKKDLQKGNTTVDALKELEQEKVQLTQELEQADTSLKNAKESYPTAARKINEEKRANNNQGLGKQFKGTESKAETDKINENFNKSVSEMSDEELSKGLFRRQKLVEDTSDELSPRALQNINNEIESIKREITSRTSSTETTTNEEASTETSDTTKETAASDTTEKPNLKETLIKEVKGLSKYEQKAGDYDTTKIISRILRSIISDLDNGVSPQESLSNNASNLSKEERNVLEQVISDVNNATGLALSIPADAEASSSRTYDTGSGLEVDEVSFINNKTDNNRVADLFKANKNTPFALTEDVLEAASEVLEDFNVTQDNVNAMTKFKNLVMQGIDSIVGFKPKEYAHLNYLQLFTSEGAESYAEGLDENFKNALAIAGLKWVKERGEESQKRTIDDIAALTGMSKEAVNSNNEVLQHYIDTGIPSSVVADNLGRYVVKMLKLSPKKNAEYNAMNKLERSIGSALLLGLAKSGIVEFGEKKGTYNSLGEFNAKETFRYVKLVNNNYGRRATQLATQTGDLIDALSEKDREVSFPSFEAPTNEDLPTTVNKSQQKLSKAQTKALRKYSKRAWNIDTDNVTIFKLLGVDSLKQMLGYDSSVGNSNQPSRVLHARRVAGTRGRNNQIERSIDNFIAFLDHLENNGQGENQDFYFDHEFDSNNRMRMTNKTVNVQGDKLHRHMIKMKGWDYTVNDKKSRDMFKLALGQALDVKIDKLTTHTAIKKVDAILNGEGKQGAIFVDAVDALTRMLNGRSELDGTLDDDRESVLRAVAEFGEKTHTLAGLIAATKYSPTEAFTSTLPVEIDGVTNGTALALLQFAPRNVGAKFNEWLKKVGIFTNNTISYGLARESGEVAHDNYETLSIAIQKSLMWLARQTTDVADADTNDVISLADIKKIRMIGNILAKSYGHLAGTDVNDASKRKLDLFGIVRDVAKNPVMIGNYGAGNNKIISEFLAEVEDSVYTNLEKAVSRRSEDEIALIRADLEAVLEEKVNLNINNALRWQMTPAQLNKFKASVNATFGHAMEEALQSEFEEIQEVRNRFNHLISAANAYYRNAWDFEYQKAIDEKGIFTVEDQRNVEKKLNKFLPRINHVQSLEGDGRATEIQLLSNESRENKRAENRIEIPLKGNLNNGSAKLGKVFNAFADVINYGSLGAKPTVNGIQSTDSGIMMQILQDDVEALNIYDAVIVRPIDGEYAANLLNRATIELNKKTSLYRSAASNLKNIIDTYPDEYKKTLKRYLDEELNPFRIKNVIPVKLIQNAVNSTKSVLADRAKTFNEIKYTTQYNFEGGGYSTNVDEATNEQRAKEFVEGIKKLGSSSAHFNNAQTYQESVETNASILAFMQNLRNGSQVKSSDEHANFLNELIGDTFNSFINPLKVFVASTSSENQGIYDITAEEIRLNLNNGARLSGMEMGADEVLAHETVHAITKAALETNSSYSRAIRELWQQARKIVTPDDLRNAGDSPAQAQARWDYIFNNPNKIGKFSAGLHEFVAFGLTNEKLRNALRDKVSVNPEEQANNQSIFDKLRNLYAKIIRMFTERLNGVNAVSSDDKLVQLVKQLVHTHQRAAQFDYQTRFIDRMEDGVKNGLVSYVQEPLLKLLRSDALRKPVNTPIVGSAKKIVTGFAAAADIAVSGNFSEFKKVLNNVARRMGATENNLGVALMNEVQGRIDENNKFYQLAREARKTIDQSRAETAQNIKTHLRNQFVSNVTDDEEIALTKFIIKADLTTLLDTYHPEELQDILTSPTRLGIEITRTRNELRQGFGGQYNFYKRMAKSLGHMMITGKALERHVLLNAHAISRLVGTSKTAPSNASDAEVLIDRLASLEALQTLQRTEPETTTQFNTIVNREFAGNSEDNGVVFSLLTHRDYKERSLENLFAGNPMQMQKGYVREIYNPNKSFIVADESQEELLLKDGYVKQGEVAIDPQDPNRTVRHLYTSDMGTLAPWQAGAISLASMKASGTNYYNTVNRHNDPLLTVLAGANLNQVERVKQYAADSIYDDNGTPKEITPLVPVLDEAGNISGYRYMMNESTKKLLDRNLRITDVLGAMEGNMKSKVSGQEINAKVVDALIEDYQTNYLRNPEEYVRIGLDSDRPDLVELYKMMPEDMREKIRNATGTPNIFVKESLVKLLFGQRKFSIPHYFKEKQELREATNATTNMYLEPIYRLLGSPTAAKVEQVWQELIAMVKDTIVIKSFTTLIGNIGSNNILLWSMGVPVKDIAVGQEQAVRYAEEYQKTSTRLNEVNREIKVEEQKPTNANRTALITKLKAEKAKLEDAQAVNPISGLMEAGVYQSIIEDVDMLQDEFSYKSRLEEWADPFVNRLPKSAKTIGSYALLTQDTKLYQFLRRTTQLSDLAARFTLHQYNLKKGKSVEQSINEIVDTFIDYDLPTHSSIEYLNSVGGVFFTKFFLRIQKVILNVVRNNPARLLGLTLIEELMGNLSDITDSFVLFKDMMFMFNNPLSALGGYFDTHPWLNVMN